jgi:hypothetical protein
MNRDNLIKYIDLAVTTQEDLIKFNVYYAPNYIINMVNDRDDFIEELLEPQEAALIYEYVYAITDDRATPYGLKSAEEVADYILKTRE